MNKTERYKMKALTLLIIVLVTISIVGADYSISWYTIDGGGGQSSGGPYVLTGTIGQPDADFANFAEYWMQSGAGLPADLYQDGIIDYDDLLEFADLWLCICPYNWPLK